MNKNLSLDVLVKNRTFIFFVTSAFIAIGIAAAYLTPPTYKVSSTISISPSYFQNSLMREFLSEVYDPTELRSQRQSILSAALDKSFLDELSVASGESLQGEAPEQAALRRSNLLKSIEIISLQSSDFQVSVTGRDRQKALLQNEKIVENIAKVLIEKRTDSLNGLRAAIATQLDAMLPNKAFADAQQITSADALKNRISQIQNQIQELAQKFSDNHPEMKEKKARLAELQAALKGAGATAGASGTEMRAKLPTTTNSQNVVYDDLVRKYSYLNVVLMAESGPKPPYFSVVRSAEYPLSPIWPKKSLFLVWSALLGLLVSVAIVLGKDLMAQRSTEASSAEAERKRRYNLDQASFLEDRRPREANLDRSDELQP